MNIFQKIGLFSRTSKAIKDLTNSCLNAMNVFCSPSTIPILLFRQIFKDLKKLAESNSEIADKIKELIDDVIKLLERVKALVPAIDELVEQIIAIIKKWLKK